MNWIDSYKSLIRKSTRKFRVDTQNQLILLICIPCLTVSAVSLYLADLSLYLIAFVLIILLLLATYVILASKRNSNYQIRTLSNLIESMIDGDYSLRGRLQTNKAFQELLNRINDLADTLSKHKIEAKESRLLLERIMEQMDAMVLATDSEGLVVMANASAAKLILGHPETPTKTRLSDLTIGKKIVNSDTGIIDFNQRQLSGEHFLFKESFLSDGKTHQLYILTNAERLLKEKERQAWQSLLRVLSHELNNSLAPIASISQSMQSQLDADDNNIDASRLLEGVNIINERAESLNHFIASYSQLTHLPHPCKKTITLQTLLTGLTSLYPDTVFDIEDTNATINVDKEQFEQVLINIFKNSIEAMSDQKHKHIQISCENLPGWLRIAIKDNGIGIANLDNVFVPFYTTKNQGSGIGLALCRQIMFNHNGMIEIENNTSETGVTVSISLPQKTTN